MADALQWVVQSKGVAYVYHNLDDFITLGEAGADTCARNLRMILEACKDLGVTVAEEKCEGPSVCIIFLGIELDSINMEMRLPQDKLVRLRETIKSWRVPKSAQNARFFPS